MKKSELRQMIRECLKEELNKKALKESYENFKRNTFTFETVYRYRLLASDCMHVWTGTDLAYNPDEKNIKYFATPEEAAKCYYSGEFKTWWDKNSRDFGDTTLEELDIAVVGDEVLVSGSEDALKYLNNVINYGESNAGEFDLRNGTFEESLSKRDNIKTLKESRSSADIEAEIAKLQQELTQAKVAEKKASYAGKLPAVVYAWDIYLEPFEKGTWTSEDAEYVFETEQEALDAAWEHLNELYNEGELEDFYGNPADPSDYYVTAYSIPLNKVSQDILKFSNLEHLI